jgi:hypothetical protein
MDTSNLLVKLHRLASSQDENFITESFVFLLNYLLENEPTAGANFLSYITNRCIDLPPDGLAQVDIKTQFRTDSGLPDIRILTNEILVFIEVKVDSGFGKDQLVRYKTELKKLSQGKKSLLVTITRFSEGPSEDVVDLPLLWYQVAEWLEELKLKKKISEFLRHQFLGLLESRGLFMEQVGWELVAGIRALQFVTDMIDEALKSKKIPIYKATGAWGWRGYYIDKKKFYVGIYFGSPNMISMTSEEVALKNNFPREPEVGRVENGRWRNDLDLTAEDVHFFSRSKASQLRCLEEFIEKSYSYVKKLVD